MIQKNKTIAEILKHWSNTKPHELAFRFLNDGEDDIELISYRELDSSATQIAHTLLSSRHETPNSGQTRALLLFPSSLDFIKAFFGCLYSNTVAIPISLPRKNRLESRFLSVLEDASPDFILTTKTLYDTYSKQLENSRFNPVWVFIDQLEVFDVSLTLPEQSMCLIAFLQYTSGSTSAPKGVIVTNRNLVANQAMITEGFCHDEKTIFAGWLPLFHDMGLIGNVLHPLYLGIPSTLMPPMAFLQKPIRWLRAISKYKATTSGGPNFAYDLCTERVSESEITELDLSIWSLAFNGAEPIQLPTLKRFYQKFKHAQFSKTSFYPCYGLAESVLFVTGHKANSPLKASEIDKATFELDGKAVSTDILSSSMSYVSCGTSYGKSSVMIFNPEKPRAQPPNHQGEICIHGPHITSGYWKKDSSELFLDYSGRTYLKTGDLGFLDPSGDLYVTGRCKDLIIVHGRNFHPQDIELLIVSSIASIVTHGCAAFSISGKNTESVVVVAEIKRTEIKKIEPLALKERIRNLLYQNFDDISVSDIVFIKPNTLPKTSSGKIQRQKCKKMYLDKTLGFLPSPIPPAAPSVTLDNDNNEQSRLRIAIEKILENKVSDLEKPLAQYGLDSLKIYAIQEFLHCNLNASYSFTEISENLTLNKIFESLPAKKRLGKSIANGKKRSQSELSVQQQGLFYSSLALPESVNYNVSVPIRVRSPLDKKRLKSAFEKVILINPLLTASFYYGSTSLQSLSKLAHLPIFFHDISNIEDLPSQLDMIADVPYDLQKAPLFELHVFSTHDEFHLFCKGHHIICDLWSFGIFFKELLQFYSDPSRKLTKQFLFFDFVNREKNYLNSDQFSADYLYWEKECLRLPKCFNLPTDYERPALQSHKGRSKPIPFTAAHQTLFREYQKNQGVNPTTVMLSLYLLFLSKESNSSTVCTGMTTSGRNTPDMFDQIGFFANPVPFFFEVADEQSFTHFTFKVRDKQKESIKHSHIPFRSLITKLTEKKKYIHRPNYPTLFQTMYVVQNVGSLTGDLNGLLTYSDEENTIHFGENTLSSYPWRAKITNHDLTLFVHQTNNELFAYWDYNPELFSESTIQHFSSSLLNLTTKYLSNPSIKLDEQHKTQPPTRAKKGKKEETIRESIDYLFENIAEKNPSSISARIGEQNYSYYFINRISNQLAIQLANLGIKPGDLVGVYSYHNIELIVAILGIMKIGAAFCPIDPSKEQSYNEDVIKSSGIKYILFDTPPELRIPNSVETFQIKTRTLLHAKQKIIEKRHDADFMAYTIFTSGSTGTPKGVVISHKSLHAYLSAISSSYPLRPKGTFGCFTSISFDLTITSIFYPLVHGGCIEIIAPNKKPTEQVLEAVSNCPYLDQIKITPSHLKALNILESFPKGLSAIIIGGEQLWTSTLVQLQKASPKTSIINEYGPTETTVGTIYEIVDEIAKEHQPVPIGTPLPETEYNNPDTNELILHGPQLSYGYWQNPRLTSSVFQPSSLIPGERSYRTGDKIHLENNKLLFKGRFDRQVKVHGYRIELDEIEQAIKAIPGVEDAIVLSQTFENKQEIEAHYISKNAKQLSASDLRKILSSKLTSYKVPQFIHQHSYFPVTPNGKTDLAKLMTITKPSALPAEKLNATEKILRNIWSSVFRKSADIGAEDNFFHLGGDSIKAIEVVALAKKAGLKFSTQDLFKYPTISELSSKVQTYQKQIDVSRNPTISPLAPIQKLSLDRTSHSSHYNLSALFSLDSKTTFETLEKLIHKLTVVHPIFRTILKNNDAGYVLEYNNKERSNLQTSRVTIDGESIDKWLQRNIAKLQSSLDIHKNLLFHVLVIKDKNRFHLLFIAHHLLVDGISWRILRRDIETLCRNASLDHESCSYPAWVNAMNFWSQSPAAEEEKNLWGSHLNTKALTGKNTYNQVFSRNSFKIPALSRFLNDINHRKQSSIIPFIYSLFCTLKFKNIVSDVIDIETHGRSSHPSLDLENTLGWFTSIHPFKHNIDKNEKATFNLNRIQHSLDRLGDASDRFLFLDLPKVNSEYLLNFLGSADEEQSDLVKITPIIEHSKAAGDASPYKLELNILQKGDTLEFYCYHCPSSFAHTELSEFLKEYCNHLENIIIESSRSSSPINLSSLDLTQIFRASNLPDKNQIAKVYPLSSTQEEILFHYLRYPQDRSFYEIASFDIKGSLDTKIFDDSFQSLAKDVEALKMKFHHSEQETPVIIIQKDTKIEVEVLSEIKNPQKVWNEERFDLEKEIPFKVYLIKKGEDLWQCIWFFHHIILDGWSLMLLFDSWLKTYKSLTASTFNNSQERNNLQTYYQFLRTTDYSPLQFWKQYLQDYNEPVELPTINLINHGKNLPVFRSLSLSLEEGLVIRNTCKTAEITLNHFFAFTWGLALYAITGKKDVVFGTAHSGRISEIENVENLIGLFVKTLPCRVSISHTKGILELLHNFKNQEIEKENNQFCSLSDIFSLTPLGSKLINTLFVFENYRLSGEAVELTKSYDLPFQICNSNISESVPYDLAISVLPHEKFQLDFQYNRNTYSEDFIEVLMNLYKTLLIEMANKPEVSIKDLKTWGNPKHSTATRSLIGKSLQKPKYQNIAHFFEESSGRFPNKIAVVEENASYTFEFIDDLSSKLAHYFIEQGLKSEDIVAVKLPRSARLVVCWIGILKAGLCYLPVDTKIPSDRLESIVSEAQPSILIHDDPLETATTPSNCNVTNISNLLMELQIRPKVRFELAKFDQTCIAYVLFTSGTTGVPKGICVEHRSLINHYLWAKDHFAWTSNDRMLHLTAPTFDVSICELHSLLFGGTLIITPEKIKNELTALKEYIEAHKPSILQLVPSLLNAMLEQGYANSWSSIRHVLCGAEALNPSILKQWFSTQSAHITNIYGLTETTIDCTFKSYRSRKDLAISIGNPIANCQAKLLNDIFQIMPRHTRAELYISGKCLARGYIGKPALTAEKFIPDPHGKGSRIFKTRDLCQWDDNGLRYIERLDQQVKIHGQRVELQEINSVAQEHPLVIEGHAVYEKLNTNSSQLSLYYRCLDELPPNTLRNYVKSKLPSYMVPDVLIPVKSVPRTAHGKLDLSKLVSLNKQQKTVTKPVDNIEKRLVQLLSDLLNKPTEQISTTDGFFELGGNSLLLMQLHSMIVKEFGNVISINSLFEYSSVIRLSSILRNTEGNPKDDEPEFEKISKRAKRKRSRRR